MKRQAITNTNGKWFDLETAELYSENQEHNGSNWISLVTGSQFKHESLYRTSGGKWILNCWSNFQGTTETYELISREQASKWFTKQMTEKYNMPQELEELAELDEI